ncbi:MAG: hypothetical protein NT067_01580 [Candidatus Diapherotrites archaeon]|nr:hypothetical protein [Candidatus Diapherotrites archaeon]
MDKEDAPVLALVQAEVVRVVVVFEATVAILVFWIAATVVIRPVLWAKE